MELLIGRKKIVVDENIINSHNILNIVHKTYSSFSLISNNIDYLYNYYKGKQDIINKTKETREDINNITIINRAFEIVTFKKGYTLGEPIQYISRGKENTSDEINKLNNYMLLSNKKKCDSCLMDWLLISGVGYRLVTANPNYSKETKDSESPIKIRSLDPRYTYLIYSNDIDETVLASVTFKIDESGTKTFYVYTKDKYYVIKDDEFTESPNPVGDIPVIEYISGESRLGSFEVVISILNTINNIQSCRTDDIEQAVNSILAILGADMDEDTYKKMQEWKTIVLPSGTDAKYLTSVLDQNSIQSLVDDLYKSVLTIVGMPNRNGGSSTSDTGQAVIYRDGFFSAETHAKNLENEFEYSEYNFLKLALRLINNMLGLVNETLDLSLYDIEVKFGRRYADNILTKVQALTQLLDAGIKPEIAIATCGIWSDPVDVTLQSKETLDKVWGEDSLDVRNNGR